jgi:hypothetical protein
MAGHRFRSRCPSVGDTLSRFRRAQAPAERSDAVADRVLVRHASCGNLADATRSLANRASARCTLRPVGVRPQVNRSVSERRRHAFRRAADRDANRRRQLVVRLVGDRCHRPLADAREKSAAHSGPYCRKRSAWDLLPSHDRVFHAHRRVPCRDRSRDRWRGMRGARGYGCDHDAAARTGCRFGPAASSCSGPTFEEFEQLEEFPKDSGPMAGTRAWLAWVVGMTILCHSSQIMLTEYPPAPASNTVPLPGLSTPTHRPGLRAGARSICWRTTTSMPR